MTYFINGLHPSIQSIVARFRGSQLCRSLTYNQFIQYARREGGAFCLQSRETPSIRLSTSTCTAYTQSVNLSTEPVAIEESGGLLVIQEGESLTVMIPTSALPLTKDKELLNYVETVSIANSQRMVRGGSRQGQVRCNALGTNFAAKESTPNLVGWIDHPMLICHSRYLHPHYSPDYRTKVLAEPKKAIRNYMELDSTDQLCVPVALYRRTKVLVELETAEELKHEVNNAQKN